MAGVLIGHQFYKELCDITRWWRHQPRGGPPLHGRGGRQIVPFLFRRFMPLEAMEAGGSCKARAVVYNEITGEVGPTTAYDDFYVYDVTESWSVSADEAENAETLKLFGWAVHPHDVDRWEILSPPDEALTLYEVSNTSYNFLYHDDDVDAWYVWGKPCLETAEPVVVDASAAEEKLYVTSFYRDAQDRVDGMGNFGRGRRFYTATRNGRREILCPALQDARWLNCSLSETPPPGAVAYVTSAIPPTSRDGRDELVIAQHGDDPSDGFWIPRRFNVILDGQGGLTGDYANATRAVDQPVWAMVKTWGYSLTAGKSVGPAPDSWYLYRYLPGFTIAGSTLLTDSDQDEDEDDITRALVIADITTKCWWAKASADWHDDGNYCGNGSYVDAYPAFSDGGSAYDGSQVYLPEIIYRIYLPRNGSDLDPNIHADDYFLYTFATEDAPRDRLVGAGNYLDGTIGQVRMMITGNAGPGWALMDGTANSVGNGGSGIDMSGRFPFFGTGAATGGSTTHTHTSVSVTAGAVDVADDTAANHMPPWQVVAPYERIH